MNYSNKKYCSFEQSKFSNRAVSSVVKIIEDSDNGGPSLRDTGFQEHTWYEG